MGAFTSKKIIYGNPDKIPYIAEEIRKSFIHIPEHTRSLSGNL